MYTEFRQVLGIQIYLQAYLQLFLPMDTIYISDTFYGTSKNNLQIVDKTESETIRFAKNVYFDISRFSIVTTSSDTYRCHTFCIFSVIHLKFSQHDRITFSQNYFPQLNLKLCIQVPHNIIYVYSYYLFLIIVARIIRIRTIYVWV